MRSATIRTATGLLSVFALLLGGDARALRIMDYNLLNYSSGREAYFQTIVGHIDPDVVVVEEILSQTAVNRFRDQVLNAVEPGAWEAGPFHDGYDTDNAIFFRTARIDSVAHWIIPTALRDIDEWTLFPSGYESADASFRIYAVHLKASTGSDNEQKRLAEVQNMRARMESFPPGQSYIVTGDCNIYTSSELAYQYMLSSAVGLAGVVQDPIDRPGNWHDGSSFASIHTQSTRTTAFGGGATGGLDDRFDLMLVGPALQDGEGMDVLDSTYTACGQDGLHFNRSLIDSPPDTVVPSNVLQALYQGSDHLPLYADYQLPALLLVDASLEIGPVIVGGATSALLSVSNPAVVPADELDYSMETEPPFSAPAGTYQAEAGAPPNQHAIGLDGSDVGFFSADLTLVTDSPDDPSRAVALSGTVLRHATPSVRPDFVQTIQNVDFGTHPPGSFADAGIEGHNFGYDELQALLEIYQADLVGDARFSVVGGFDPVTVGDTPAAWILHFDDTGATDGVYEATLTLHTRDQQDLEGAIDRSDLVYNLSATVQGGSSDVAEGPGQAVPDGIGSISPNPFQPWTEIRFGLSSTEPVRVAVFDVHGRIVRNLISGALPMGEHRVVWDGRDDRGREVPAGFFLVRMEAADFSQSRSLVRIR
jgi:hypothetical protein